MSWQIRTISLIDNLHFGGDENRLLAFSQTIDRRRFDHTIVTISRANSDVDRRYGGMRQLYSDAGVEVIDLGEENSNTEPLSIRAFQLARTGTILSRVVQKLIRLIHERNIKIINVHLNASNPVGVLAGLITGARTIVTTYYVTNYTREPIRLRAARQFTLGMADAVVTDSEARSRDIREWSIRPRPRVLVIPNGVSPPSTSRTSMEMRRTLGLPTDPKIRIIGQVSSLIEYKGHKVLLAAARSVLEKDPDVAFLLVGYSRGGDSYKRSLEKEAADLGISDRVRILGYPGCIGDVWKAIDVHVHASLFDSLPNAIIESMSLAKPAVVTSVGGIPEMVEHERTGLVVPPGDPTALSQGLLRLLRTPVVAERLGEAARKRYQERYRPELMTRRLEDLFINLVA
jgi:glycosyltransferase involved in cell wall biosynthesis